MRKNLENITLRRNDILKSYEEKGRKSMKVFVLEQAERFRLSEATIWNDIKYFRRNVNEFRHVRDMSMYK